jgi:hypothetical protein
MATSYENKAEILSELWLNYKDDQNFEEFIKYNDLGLPLAYAISEGIVESTELAAGFVSETFELLLAGLGIPEDIGFENLDEMIQEAGE